MKMKDRPKLTNEQREANVFVRNMSNSNASVAYVNPEYFEPLYKVMLPNNDFHDGCKLGGVEIRIDHGIKKYYFVK